MLAASQAALLLDFFGLNGLAWLHRSMWFLNGSAAICTDALGPEGLDDIGNVQIQPLVA